MQLKPSTNFLCLLAMLSIEAPARGATAYEASTIIPPKPASEFRGVWIPGVGENSWLARCPKTTAAQKAELIAILDRAAELKLNAVIFQVRAACDALYASKLEPWSEYLAGTMGKAPEPFYDPLAFMIEQAHKRGLELHAWFNPYRAHHFLATSPISANHVSRTRPGLVRQYGRYLWLDPGDPAVQEYSLSVVMDVVKRYDIDGVHFDDYFYPERDDSGANDSFPDDETWKRYGVRSGLNRDDWRRENVDAFVQRVYRNIKAAKPWVKFGIAPFGIWRPGYPPSVRGKDAYSILYADSRKWLAEGWLDYFAPQLYWPMDSPQQSFPALLNWWSEQNPKHRHLWPGLAAYRWKADEIAAEVACARRTPGVSGFVLFSASSVMDNALLDREMARTVNTEPALVPASPWLAGAMPAKPTLAISGGTIRLKLSWSSVETNSVRWWLVQTKTAGEWKTELFPAKVLSRAFAIAPEAISVTAVDRAGNLSAPSVLQVKKNPPPSSPPPPAKRKKLAPPALKKY